MRKGLHFWRGIRGAWEMLIDFPLPATFPGRGKEASAVELLFWFPLLGILIGSVLTILCRFITLLTNAIAGAVIFALLSLAVLLFKDSLRGLILLVSLLINRFNTGTFAGAVRTASADRRVLASRSGAVVAGILVLLAFLSLLLMALSGSCSFIIAVLCGSFTVQGAMTVNFEDDNGTLLVDDDEHYGIRWMWVIAIFAALILLLIYPLATAFGIGAVCLLVYGFGAWVSREVTHPGAEMVTLGGTLAEAALLLISFLWTL